MHPVLIYGLVFIATTVGLLFLFEKYPIGSIYLLLLISVGATAIIGKILINFFPNSDPMQDELDKENNRVRSNQYQREIQYLFNIVQPDPKYQPSVKRNSQNLLESFDLDENLIMDRLKNHFGPSFCISISQSLPDLVEEITNTYQDWPGRGPFSS